MVGRTADIQRSLRLNPPPAAIIDAMTNPIIPGAEPGRTWATAHPVHSCCTASPATRRRCVVVAEALAAAGFHVELPRLPGHGTVVDDMLPTRWADWAGEAEAAYQRLAQRAAHVVVVGLSMGGALDPAARGRPSRRSPGSCASTRSPSRSRSEIIDMLRGLADGGTAVLPGHRQRHRRSRCEGERVRRHPRRAAAVACSSTASSR